MNAENTLVLIDPHLHRCTNHLGVSKTMNHQDLSTKLISLENKPYPAYKSIKGRYNFPLFDLSVDYVQGDPFASPSRLSIRISHEKSKLPSDLFCNESRKTGTETCIARAFSLACRNAGSRTGSGKSGMLSIDTPGQEILKRTCVEIDESKTTIRFSVGLPANGRRIMGKTAAHLLTETIVGIVEENLLFDSIRKDQLYAYAEANEDADFIRSKLDENGLVAFVADGAVLPRASGVDERPMDQAIPFESPTNLKIGLDLPNAGHVTGMGIQNGITLIVGGGYHGKSTLLRAIERGVYNHIPGDGRERVITRRDATKVRAEDGRSVAGVNLSPFINNLPGGRDTTEFSTENASGSTSQAASIIEALEAEVRTLLIDEDISATNFLIRDSRMQKLIAPEKEPITPFVQKIRSLYETLSVSVVIVLGGSSDYFEPADCVIAMENYIPLDVTHEAKALCAEPYPQTSSTISIQGEQCRRYAVPKSISPFKKAAPYRGNRHRESSRPPRKNIKAPNRGTIHFGTEEIDLSSASQLVDTSQTRAIGAALAFASQHEFFHSHSLVEALKAVLGKIDADGLNVLDGNDFAEFRLQELSSALNRLRSLEVEMK